MNRLVDRLVSTGSVVLTARVLFSASVVLTGSVVCTARSSVTGQSQERLGAPRPPYARLFLDACQLGNSHLRPGVGLEAAGGGCPV